MDSLVETRLATFLGKITGLEYVPIFGKRFEVLLAVVASAYVTTTMRSAIATVSHGIRKCTYLSLSADGHLHASCPGDSANASAGRPKKRTPQPLQRGLSRPAQVADRGQETRPSDTRCRKGAHLYAERPSERQIVLGQLMRRVTECVILMSALTALAQPALTRSYLNCSTRKVDKNANWRHIFNKRRSGSVRD